MYPRTCIYMRGFEQAFGQNLEPKFGTGDQGGCFNVCTLLEHHVLTPLLARSWYVLTPLSARCFVFAHANTSLSPLHTC